MRKRYLFLIVCILYATVGQGQVSPIKDKNWVLNRALSDEFNGTSVDTTKWEVMKTTAPGWGFALYNPSNVTIEDLPTRGINPGGPIASSNRMLRMKAASMTSTGGIRNKNANYLYGYYEMRAKLPGYFNDSLQQPCNRGFFTAFFTYHQIRDPNDWNCIIEHEEIDIVEPSGAMRDFYGEWIPEDDAQTNEVGHHMIIDSSSCDRKKLSPKVIQNLPPLYENFHKFAAECLPDRIIYYFDDVPFHTVYEGPFPNTLMRVAMINQLRNGIWPQYPNVFEGYNTPWPIYFDVDYFRYYQLNIQYCNADALIINNTQLSNFVYGVRRNIIIGNGTAAISLNAGESVTFRATNDVTINGEFTVPLGCELNIIPTPCH
jgi:beta-glucanase (GH16 family)